MLVDEITKLEEIESVKISIDLNTEDMVVNHYKDCDDDEIVSEVHPLPLFKKYNIPAMASEVIAEQMQKETKEEKLEESYLLFKVKNHSYAIASKYVKEVLEKSSEFFALEGVNSHLRGAMAVRDEVIPVAELEPSDISSDVLVLEIEGNKLGVIVDEVYDIENFISHNIEVIERSERGVCGFYNHKGKVIAILDPEFYFEGKSAQEKSTKEMDEKSLQHQKFDYLLFLIDDKKFSVDMSCVRQVVETDSLQKTQSSSIVVSDNVEFITTWNHRAVNIIRLDLELGLECKKQESQSIFIEFEGHTVAFMVHDIDNIVYINKEDITNSSLEEKALINGAILYEGEVIVKLSEQNICSLG
jgi:chemotaxis signal transduction protein